MIQSNEEKEILQKLRALKRGAQQTHAADPHSTASRLRAGG